MAGGPVCTGKGDNKKYPGKLSFDILVACIVAAMGVLIFGYGIMGNSGGVTSMPMFLRVLFSDVPLTWFTSSWYLSALLSSLVASLVASTVTRKFGRRLSRLSAALIFCAGALIDTFAVNVGMLILGRILLGFGIGFAANQSVPN